MVPSGSPPRSARAGPARVPPSAANSSASPRAKPSSRCAEASITAVTIRVPDHVPTSRRPSAATLGSPTFAMSTGGGPARPAAADRIHVSNAPLTASVSANTSGWSHSTDVSTVRSGRYGSKLPAYSSASTTNGPEPQRAVAGAPPVTDVGSSAPTNAAGSAPAATRVCTSQPEVVLFPCVPATATSVRPAAASATTCCHGSSGMPAARAAASSGWSGSTAVRAFVTASRCGREDPSRAPGHGPRQAGCRPPGGQACIARAHRDRSRSRHHRHAGARSAAALAPAPAAPTTWIRSPATIGRAASRPGKAGSDSRGVARHEPSRSSSSSSAAAALSRLFAERSPDHRWRRTSAPASSATAT